MKPLFFRILGLALLSVGFAFPASAADNPPGYVDFGKLSPSASGGQFVQVHINNDLIALTARLAQKDQPDFAELLRGLEGNKQAVLVNIVGDIKPEKVAAIGERFNIEPLKKLGSKFNKPAPSEN